MNVPSRTTQLGRLWDDLNVEGYDPEAIRKEFDDTGGMTWEEKLRAARSKKIKKRTLLLK